MASINQPEFIILGAGFTGLTIAYELVKRGIKVTVIDAAEEIGGLAAAFDVGDTKLDRFYHHWFTNDTEVMELITELDLQSLVEVNPTNTGIYYANNFFKLSTPWDLLNFEPLGFFDRIRLGLLALKARRIKNWKILEDKTSHEWLKTLGGDSVYKIVWEPLLRGKFGPFADNISAVWFWNKLKLRGGSRGKSGVERLAYLRGGFIVLAEALAQRIKDGGGEIILNAPVTSLVKSVDKWNVKTVLRDFYSKNVVCTMALPLIGEVIKTWASSEYLNHLNRIQYIGNVCLVLELNQSLSKTYWLNVNDPTFPFVGVIEHTNFEHIESYGGRHIVYLSKYLPHTDPVFSMNSAEFFEYSFPYLKEMFPHFKKSWVIKHHLWRSRWSQPIIEKNYSKLIPKNITPYSGLYICTMAQIYPEDRGTNYAIREAKKLVQIIFNKI